jgi:hypothetical protein
MILSRLIDLEMKWIIAVTIAACHMAGHRLFGAASALLLTATIITTATHVAVICVVVMKAGKA